MHRRVGGGLRWEVGGVGGGGGVGGSGGGGGCGKWGWQWDRHHDTTVH